MSERIIPEHFNFCPRCGSASIRIAADQDNRVDCPNCDFTLYFNPSCAAAALIFDKTGRLLIIKRAREPSKGKYGVPGGFSDFGERLEEVVIREAKEEVNLEIETATFLASFPNDYRFKSVIYPVTDTYFLAEVESFDDLSPEDSEVAGIHFVDPRMVPSDQWAFESLRQVIKLYLERCKSPAKSISAQTSR